MAPGTPGVVIPHLRLTWGGTLGTQGEIWANGLAFQFATPEAASEAELAAIAETSKLYLKELVTTAGMQVSPAVAIRWVKCVWITNTGKQRDVNTVETGWTAAAAPKGAGGPVPWTQTYAVTLRTAVARGRGHSGRIFPPPSGPMPDGDTPYAPVAFANTLATNYANTINTIETEGTTVLDPGGAGGTSNGRSLKAVVVSRRADDGRVALLTPITGAVVDRVADVQHRRTNRVPRAEGTLTAI